jgi:hypothetical protein
MRKRRGCFAGRLRLSILAQPNPFSTRLSQRIKAHFPRRNEHDRARVAPKRHGSRGFA